jgi:hypothetical protein
VDFAGVVGPDDRSQQLDQLGVVDRHRALSPPLPPRRQPAADLAIESTTGQVEWIPARRLAVET